MFRRQKERKAEDEKKKKKRSASVEVKKRDDVVVVGASSGGIRRRPSSGKLERFDSLSLRKCSVKGCTQYTVHFVAEHGREGVSVPVCEKCVAEMKQQQGYELCALCEKEASGDPCNHKSMRKGSRRSRRGSKIMHPDEITSVTNSTKEEHLPLTIEQLLKGTAARLNELDECK